MNPLSHFLLSYLAVDLAFGSAMGYVAVIFAFSVALDLDHLPYTLRMRGRIREKRFGAESRSRFHELYGLAAFSVALCAASLFAGILVVRVAALSLTLHYATDFLLGKSRPFFPFSGRRLFLGLCPDRFRVALEAAIFAVLVVMVWARLPGLVL